MKSGNPHRGLGINLREHARIARTEDGYRATVPFSDFAATGDSEEQVWEAFTEGYTALVRESTAERMALSRFLQVHGRRRSEDDPGPAPDDPAVERG